MSYSRSPSPSSRSPRGGDLDLEDDDVDRRSVGSGSGRSGGNKSGDEDNESRKSGSEAEEEKEKKKAAEKKKDKKPKGPVKRQMISEDMLNGTKGISKLRESFKTYEFGGKGHEKEDLNRMLSKIEQWVHTLHPKHPFDQCLERIEFLGTKKRTVKVFLKKMRMGMLPTDGGDDIVRDDDLEGENLPAFDDEGDAELLEIPATTTTTEQPEDLDVEPPELGRSFHRRRLMIDSDDDDEDVTIPVLPAVSSPQLGTSSSLLNSNDDIANVDMEETVVVAPDLPKPASPVTSTPAVDEVPSLEELEQMELEMMGC